MTIMTERVDPKAKELDRRQGERRKSTFTIEYAGLARAIALLVAGILAAGKAILEFLRKDGCQ